MDNLKCIYCGSDMVVDDKDIKFQGNYDIYYICLECSESAIVRYRYGRKIEEIW